MLRLHLSILNDYVDKFIIIEADRTFTGNPKPLHFFRDQRFFKEWWKKIEYYPMTEWDDVGLWKLALLSPNTQGADHWAREFYIKESIQKALIAKGVQDDDTLFIGDVDEILDPTVHFRSETMFKAKLRVYAYYLNNRSTEAFWGPLVAQYSEIKGKCLNHLRSDTSLYSTGEPLGWHFTSMGGIEEVRRKLNDSYTQDSYNTFDVQQLLPERIKRGVDYLGRDFTFTLDETEWPAYLKKNRTKYLQLCK